MLVYVAGHWFGLGEGEIIVTSGFRQNKQRHQVALRVDAADEKKKKRAIDTRVAT